MKTMFYVLINNNANDFVKYYLFVITLISMPLNLYSGNGNTVDIYSNALIIGYHAI